MRERYRARLHHADARDASVPGAQIVGPHSAVPAETKPWFRMAGWRAATTINCAAGAAGLARPSPEPVGREIDEAIEPIPDVKKRRRSARAEELS
jgi:hypothetical protein